MVLVMLTLALILFAYIGKKAVDHTDPDRSEEEEEGDAAKNRKKWRRRAVDWQM